MMTSGTDTRVQSFGQAWSAIRPRRPFGHIDVSEYSGKPTSHRLENVGDSPYHLFAVENLKATGWSATPAVSASATTLARESRSFRVYTVSLGRDRRQTSHTHAVPTIVILLGGKVMSDGPGEKAKEHVPAAVGLKQLDGTGQWLLVPAGDRHHLVRLGDEDGQLVEIEVR
jgi:quercetin dioxygenase-like cupin family protein